MLQLIFIAQVIAAAPTVAQVMQHVDARQYIDDVSALAQQPRTSGSAGWSAAQDLCSTRLQQLGFTVYLQQFATGVNVVGVKQGNVAPKQEILVSAHYDSVDNCNGADDNASGVAGALAVAAALDDAGVQPARTLVVACWDQEEPGMIGSTAYAKQAQAAGDDIVMSYVFEMIGFRSTAPNSQQIPAGFGVLFPRATLFLRQRDYRGDSIALIANRTDVLRLIGDTAASINLPVLDLHVPRILEDTLLYDQLKRSDHAAFWDAGYGAVMIGDTGNYRNANYHCIPAAGSTAPSHDDVTTLDYLFAEQVVQAVTGAVYVDVMNQY